MKTVSYPSELRGLKRPVVLAAGYFDGLHCGHARVIGRAVEDARRSGGEAWCLTFDSHPMRVLDPANAPALLTSNRHRMLLMERMGVDGCILLRFNRRMAAMRPESFVSMLLDGIPSLAEICAGRDWRFGRGGAGGAELLAKIAGKRGVRVAPIRPVLRMGRPVSSTRIRELIRGGRMAEAATMLGRPYSVLGTVDHGRELGRKLGFPTANVTADNEVLPPPGVYAVQVPIGDRVCSGVVNLGTRPTFGPGGAELLELHVIDFQGDLYGRRLEVFFFHRLRRERAFPDFDRLRNQISRDITRAAALLKGRKLKEALYTPAADVYICRRNKNKRKERQAEPVRKGQSGI